MHKNHLEIRIRFRCRGLKWEGTGWWCWESAFLTNATWYYWSSDSLWLKKAVDGKQSIWPRSQALEGSCNSDCLEWRLANLFSVKGKYFKPGGHKSIFHILLDLFACFYNLKKNPTKSLNYLSSETYLWPRARRRSRIYWLAHGFQVCRWYKSLISSGLLGWQ